MVSLAANGGLLAVLALKPSLAPPSWRQYFEPARATHELTSEPETRPPAPSATASPDAKQGGSTPSFAGLWAALRSDDLPTFVARLRAAGFSRPVVRSIVNARLEEKFTARFAEVMAPYNNIPYWRPDPTSGMTAGFYEQYNQLYRERSRALRELLGADADDGGNPTTSQRRQYGDLSQAKIDLVQRIADDYAEMSSQVRAAMQDVALPEDGDKLALLEREKRADLAAVLSPAELEAYERRTSPITMRLRSGLTIMDATEEEFGTIYRIQTGFQEILYPEGGMFTPDGSTRRLEAQRQQGERLKVALGEARNADYVRASNREYQQLHRIAQRENVPLDATQRAFALRDSVAQESMRIAGNQSIDTEAKHAALKQLAQNTRLQLTGLLGPAAGAAYAQAARWLGYVENGSAVSIDVAGNVTFRRATMPGN